MQGVPCSVRRGIRVASPLPNRLSLFTVRKTIFFSFKTKLKILALEVNSGPRSKDNSIY